ncbi:hypothetical protein V22_32560 [Calycomorphotria hydatis]|uniref:Uncharacterized protein n=1 Tax=Calycomorphotria hydatis TaxID=2528027 RepID=A0A517TC93_9PLAN|nr:hypothetical protein V22_32560 [Calycomorphotria hydatis]
MEVFGGNNPVYLIGQIVKSVAVSKVQQPKSDTWMSLSLPLRRLGEGHWWF